MLGVEYTLPVNSHSASLATKTPSMHYVCEPKFIPDYGGAVEISNSNIKNNSLYASHPYRIDQYRGIFSPSYTFKPRNLSYNNCLDYHQINEALTVIHSYDDKVCVTRTHDIKSKQLDFQPNHMSLNDVIVGIKREAGERLLVTKQNGIQVININSQDSNFAKSYDNSFSNESDKTFTIKFNEKCDAIDSSMNKFNNFLSFGGNFNDSILINIIDFNNNYTQPIYSIKIPTTKCLSLDNEIRDYKSGRKFIALDDVEKVISINHSNNHIALLEFLTSDSFRIVDPRKPMNKQIDISSVTSLPSCSPIERFTGIKPSFRNQNQYYLLSNVHLRVFDSRWPGIPMNQLNHMLDSKLYLNYGIEVFNRNNSTHEMIACRCSNRICLLSFNQDSLLPLKNPKSLHPPFHDIVPSEDVIGLKLLQTTSPEQFKILYSDIHGRLFSSCFNFQEKSYDSYLPSAEQISDLEFVDTRSGLTNDSNGEPVINNLFTDDYNVNFESHRANEALKKMKNIFRS